MPVIQWTTILAKADKKIRDPTEDGPHRNKHHRRESRQKQDITKDGLHRNKT